MSNLLPMTVAGSVIVGLMLLLRPVTARIFPARWQYRIGKMAIVFFLVPVSLFAGKLPSVLPHTITPSQYSAGISSTTIPEEVQSNGLVDTMDSLLGRHFPMTIEKNLPVEVMQMILFIWFMGAIVFVAWHFYCYHRFIKRLRADSIPVPDDAAAVLLSLCKAALSIHGDVKLMLNPKITSPMLVGLRRPMILLPTSNMQEIDLKLVLTHELMHLKRKDLWVKMLALLAGTLHWFNPFVHVLRKDVGIWGELSCDEALTCEMSHEERKLYGEAILNTLDNHSGINTAFCSSFCESKKYIERRLSMLLDVKKTKKHVTVFAIVAILVIASVGTAVSALAADNSTLENENEVITSLIPPESGAVVNFTDNEKIVELKGDGKEYTFEEFKQWLETARLEATELVKKGIWTQEQANKHLAHYEKVIAEIEKNGGMTFEELINNGNKDKILPEKVETFYTTDELIFELPAKLADAVYGEAVRLIFAVRPQK